MCAGARATGVDLTDEGVSLTRERLALEGIADRAEVGRADAEALPFADASFDIVYSWGVLHHTPDTERAFREARRVLTLGGQFRGMIYHTPSWVGLGKWAIHYAARGRQAVSLRRAVYETLESPGTKAYTLREARMLVEGAGFRDVRVRSQLSHGDLLMMRRSAKYTSGVAGLLWRMYPRWLVKRLGNGLGTGLLIEATAGH